MWRHASGAEAHNRRADLRVMSADGHSRLKEFVLGGAAKETLITARIPLFMSHEKPGAGRIKDACVWNF